MSPDDVHVWPLRLDLPEGARQRLEAVLSFGELARARRLVRASDSARFVSAHGLLRLVLSSYVGTGPRDIELEEGPGGKPCLADSAGPRFNLSHAGSLGLVAVSARREVGVDIEEIRDVGDVQDLARRCFSPAERAALAAVAPPMRRQAFFAGWTRKEAFLKAVGDGLRRRLDSFDVALTPGEPARLLRVDGAPGAAERCALRALEPAPGYVAAVAALGAALAIRRRPWVLLAALVEGLGEGAEESHDCVCV
jgi:4'-phosphopantetheinyl transferase